MKHKEIKPRSVTAMFFTAMISTLLLIPVNIILDLDRWPIPLMLISAATLVTTHILRRPADEIRMYFCAFVTIVDLYYYCTNVKSIYDCTPFVVLTIAVMALSDSRLLVHITAAVGVYGMVYDLMDSDIFLRHLTFVYVFYTILHFAAIVAVTIAANAMILGIRRLEDGYVRRLSAMERENKSASDFLANVSHEIRTPINAVIGLTHVLLDNETDTSKREALTSVNEAGNRIASQISDILDYSDIDMRQLSKMDERWSVSSLTDDLINRLAPLMKDSVELIADIDPHIPAVMVSDPRKIGKILWHVISNGIKYTKEGGVYARLYSVRRDYGANLCIEVIDTGIGMTDEELGHIFKQFYQANSGRTRSSSGLGLGLSIVYGFVASLGGFINIESAPGKGTSVRISIPNKIEDPADCMDIKDRDGVSICVYIDLARFSVPAVREYYVTMIRHLSQGLRVGADRVETIDDLKGLIAGSRPTHLFVGSAEYERDRDYINSLAGIMTVTVITDSTAGVTDHRIRTISKPFFAFPLVNIINDEKTTDEGYRLYCHDVRALVVDDEPMNLTVAQGIMGRYGISVSSASSGIEAIDMVRSYSYDIIFMDHMMPGMDGVTAMKKIRSILMSASVSTPIVALTANAVSSAKDMFLAEGFDGFVSKPIDLKELEHVLKRVLPADKLSVEPVHDAPPVMAATDATDAQAPVSDDPMDILRSCGIDTDEGLRYFAGDMQFYRDMLSGFAADCPTKLQKLETSLAAGAMPDYAIVVHALKSSAKMIGANGLSEAARELELASKDGDSSFVNEHHAPMAALYTKTAEAIRSAFGADAGSVGDNEVEEPAPEENALFEILPDDDTVDDELLEMLPDEDTTDDELFEILPDDDGLFEILPEEADV